MSPTPFSMSPFKFYRLVEEYQQIQKDFADGRFEETIQGVEDKVLALRANIQELARANNDLMQEVRRATRHSNPFMDLEKDPDEDPLKNLRHTAGGQSFLAVIYHVLGGLHSIYGHFQAILPRLVPEPLTLSGQRCQEFEMDPQKLLIFKTELSMAQEPMGDLLGALADAEVVPIQVIKTAAAITEAMDIYHRKLIERHQTEGVMIHGDPISTDVAMSIFENVDAHGEIEHGTKLDQVSAYTVTKARVLIEGIQVGIAADFIGDPSKLIDFLTNHLLEVWELAKNLRSHTHEPYLRVTRVLRGRVPNLPIPTDQEFLKAMDFLRDMDPQHIQYRERVGILTPEEIRELAYKNETLAEIVRLLPDEKTKAEDIVQYVLERKSKKRHEDLKENSFYVCKMGAGNPFLGSAPGELTVHPAPRPVASIKDIVGSGFDEVRTLITNTHTSAEWYDLFVATSPSRSGDKSNCLLVGPQGSGKSEVLRTLGGDTNSIGIFATGSDFLTCWKGEAEKNPKRLFEAALRIQKDTGKHVFILIDEIDAVMGKETGHEAFGGTNLRTEFQNLMDGVVNYPHLSVWGATNHLDRIAMPMIRRFAKVLIVGELSQEDRIHLLQHFTSFLPYEGFSDSHWDTLAKRLEGAVGDVVRKVVDDVWRPKMAAFTRQHPEEATKLKESLSPDGVRFTIQDFTAEKREALHRGLRRWVSITPSDLDDSISKLLGNLAVRAEIETAKQTYENARAILSQWDAPNLAVVKE